MKLRISATYLQSARIGPFKRRMDIMLLENKTKTDWFVRCKMAYVEKETEDEGRLGSTAVSRFCTGKMLPDVVSCQKIARSLDLPIELILCKATLIDQLPKDANWIQRVIGP